MNRHHSTAWNGKNEYGVNMAFFRIGVTADTHNERHNEIPLNVYEIYYCRLKVFYPMAFELDFFFINNYIYII